MAKVLAVWERLCTFTNNYAINPHFSLHSLFHNLVVSQEICYLHHERNSYLSRVFLDGELYPKHHPSGDGVVRGYYDCYN